MNNPNMSKWLKFIDGFGPSLSKFTTIDRSNKNDQFSYQIQAGDIWFLAEVIHRSFIYYLYIVNSIFQTFSKCFHLVRDINWVWGLNEKVPFNAILLYFSMDEKYSFADSGNLFNPLAEWLWAKIKLEKCFGYFWKLYCG